jgi:hypothetical protein
MKYLDLAIAVVCGVVLGAEYHPFSVKALVFDTPVLHRTPDLKLTLF